MVKLKNLSLKVGGQPENMGESKKRANFGATSFLQAGIRCKADTTLDSTPNF